MKVSLRQKWISNLESLEHMKSEGSPLKVAAVKTEETPPLRIMGILVEERKRSVSPGGEGKGGEGGGESSSVPRLYPFQGFREVDPGITSEAIKSFRRLKSWDLIFARKSLDSKQSSRSAQRAAVINIHTHRVKVDSRPSTRSIFSRSMSGPLTLVQTLSPNPCLAINTIEMVQPGDKVGDSAPPTARKVERIVKSSHSQFRWKRVGSLDCLPAGV